MAVCVCVAVAVCQTQDPRGWSAGHQRRWTDAPFAGNTLAQSWKFALKKNKKPRENKDKNEKKKEMRKREKERKKREGKGMGRKKKGEGKRDGKEMSEKWGKK